MRRSSLRYGADETQEIMMLIVLVMHKEIVTGAVSDAVRVCVSWYSDETARSEQQGCGQDRPEGPLLLGPL